MSIIKQFNIDFTSKVGIQNQLKAQVITAIKNRKVSLDTPLPSSRNLSKQLAIARNSVVLAYADLLNDGYLIAKPRRGYFINPDVLTRSNPITKKKKSTNTHDYKFWSKGLRTIPSRQSNYCKEQNLENYKYLFTHQSVNRSLFPINHWENCYEQAIRKKSACSIDSGNSDDRLLIEQIHTRLLPRRGIIVEPEQILITRGAQHALFLLTYLLLDRKSIMGIESPGDLNIYNIASLSNVALKDLEVDEDGLIINHEIDECDLIYTTPSHQNPTNVTMTMERRVELLDHAKNADIILIEDDSDSEMNYHSSPLPALKSLDRDERVIYINDLSQTLLPELQTGYIVGPVELIQELRALRNLMQWYSTSDNAHAIALFLAEGYHDQLVHNLTDVYKERIQTASYSIEKNLPKLWQRSIFGNASYWVKGHRKLNAITLKNRAKQAGILIDSGDTHFLGSFQPKNFFRLGFTSIETHKIEPGIKALTEVIQKLK